MEIQDAVAKAGQVVREAVGGLQTVRSFGAEEHEVCRYKEALERCRQLWWRRDLEKGLYDLANKVRQHMVGRWPGGEGTAGERLLVPGSLALSLAGAAGWKDGKAPSASPLSSPAPAAAPGRSGADPELRAAADPGRRDHPGRAAILSALPGGRGAVRSRE